MRNTIQILLITFLFSISFLANAQINMPRPSPDAKVMQKIGMAEVAVSYCRPQAKGRKIFGEVVPFEKIWRTGANSPTKISISDSIAIQGKKIAAGEYAIYSIPSLSEWTIIFGKNPWVSAGEYKDEQEIVRFKVKSESIPNFVEAFTISFVNITPTSAELEIAWEKTAVKFKLEYDADAKVMADIKAKTDLDPNALSQAAGYYYDTNRDLNQALQWITIATDKNPQFWTLHTKSKIQLKLKDYKGAIATAQKSMDMAKNAKNEEYVKFNEKIIAEAKSASPVSVEKTKKK
ncbi:MAG: DUF2911 domain-containing protein [Cytophagales bacterium]|nr:MAG: DUF2911 domain-containing protein [Cytophagales bacterium]